MPIIILQNTCLFPINHPFFKSLSNFQELLNKAKTKSEITQNIFNILGTAIKRKATYLSSKDPENARTRKTCVKNFHGNIHESAQS